MLKSADLRATARAGHRLDIDGLRVRYGSIVALDDVFLSLERGEVVALLGPSGCGKMTLLRTGAGFVRQSFGQVRIDGRTVDELPPNRRDIGIVFQNYALFPHMSVAENVAYGLRARGQRGAAVSRRVAELLDLVQLGPLRDRRPSQLSGGQQQRVALARALAIGPRILLLDEPRRSARPQPPPRHADRDQAAVAQPWGDRDPRHPRPGRGDERRRPDRGDAPRQDRAARLSRCGV
jgi:putative spermidine/putrescine transport system ATP-binding protein